MPDPLTVAAVRLWLESIERAYGPDVPLLLVAPWGGPAWAVQGATRPPLVPIVDLLLDYGGGHAAGAPDRREPGAQRGPAMLTPPVAATGPPPCCCFCRWGWRVDAGLWVAIGGLLWWLMTT